MEDRFRDGKLTKLSFAHTTFFQIRLTNVFREQLHSVFHFPNVQLLSQRCVYSSTSLLYSSAIQYSSVAMHVSLEIPTNHIK